jgi:hypothetical protein
MHTTNPTELFFISLVTNIKSTDINSDIVVLEICIKCVN